MESNMEAPELLPCPFCGEHDLRDVQLDHGEAYVECRKCDAYGPNGGVAAWNIRADLAAPPAPAEVGELVERFDIYLDDFDHLAKMPSADGEWVRYADHATALTSLQAENERLQKECADAWDKCEERRKQAEKAEAERDTWKANAEALASKLHAITSGMPVQAVTFETESRAALAAHAKLKGDV